MRNLIVLLAVCLLAGCATVPHNGSKKFVKEIDYPKVGKVVTAYVGDHLVEKGFMYEENVLVVRYAIDGTGYDIPAGRYVQVGYNETRDFYDSIGVTHSLLFDPPKALAVKRGQNSEICVVSLPGGLYCYQGDFGRKKQYCREENSFQQTLIYSGRVGNKINVGYREFNSDLARPAFDNEVEYDLSVSKTIGYKGALIEVIKADNMSITYRLIRNFR